MSALDRYFAGSAPLERRKAPVTANITSDTDLLFWLRFIADNERRADNRQLLYVVTQRLAEILEVQL